MGEIIMKKDTKRKRILILAACAITLVCFGCKNEEEDEPAPTPIVVESVTIDKTTLTLTLGETIKLTATIKPENADDKTVKWSSSNKTIATVDNDGTVTTVKVGSATITAQSGDKEAKCAITVHEHSYSDGKCTVCGTVLSWKYGTINENGILTKYSGYEATVEIPYGVISIGNKAFEKGYNLIDFYLKEVKIPASVTSIGDSAFENCTKLAVVTIPASVTSIGSNPFKGCENLSEIQFEGTKEQWNAIEGSDKTGIPGIRCSDGNIGVLGVPSYLKVSGTTVTGYTSKIPADLVIPDGVTGIGSSALSRCTNLESVTIPGSVTYIGKEAFYGCTNLTSVTMDDGTTSIGESAFYNCENLTSVTIPASVTSIGWKAFLECTNLSEIQFNGTKEQWNAIEGRNNIGIPGIRCSDGVIGVLGVPSYLSISGTKVSGYTDAIPSNVVIPDGVTEIGDYAFNRCKNLESITIPASVTKISYNAFENCTNLTNVTIPSSVKSIGDKSFYMCNNLMKVTYTGTLADWCGIDWGYSDILGYENPLHNEKAILYINDSAVTDAVIPNSVTEIKEHAFYGYKNLTSVTIPVSVTSIGGNAFIGCTGLTKVTYTGTLADWCAIDWENSAANPLYNEKAILYINGLAVTDAKIPNNVTEIKKWAFCRYKNLTSVEIPSSVESIGKSAFYGCTKLASIHYDGTQSEWEKIERDTDGLSGKTITGKDGTWTAQ